MVYSIKKEKANNQISLMGILEFLLCFFCFFPFITPIQTGTDMQIYGFVIALVYIVYIGRLTINRKMIMQYCLCFFSLIVLFIDLILFGKFLVALKSCYNYLSLGVVSIAVCQMYRRNQNNTLKFERMMKCFIIIWFVVGFIQAYYNKLFLATIVSNYRTSTNRGICGLASEPSFYGYMCFFFIVFAMKFSKHRFIYIGLSLIQILFFAQSSVAFIYVVILLAIVIVGQMVIDRNKKAILYFIVGVAVLYTSVILINKYIPGSRIGNLSRRFLLDPLSISRDQSVEQRFSHIYKSVIGFLDYFGFPHGFSNAFTGLGRIMSGYGAALYELGFMGLIYIVNCFFNIRKGYSILYAIAISIVMFSAIQIGIPTFSFLIGYCLAKACETTDSEHQDDSYIVNRPI